MTLLHSAKESQFLIFSSITTYIIFFSDCYGMFAFPQKIKNKKGFPHRSVGRESASNARDPGLIPELGSCWRRDRLPIPVFLGFPYGSAGKESACKVRNLGWIPGLGRYPGEGKGYPLQYSGLENSMNCIVHGVEKSQT